MSKMWFTIRSILNVLKSLLDFYNVKNVLKIEGILQGSWKLVY